MYSVLPQFPFTRFVTTIDNNYIPLEAYSEILICVLFVFIDFVAVLDFIIIAYKVPIPFINPFKMGYLNIVILKSVKNHLGPIH